MKDVNMIMAVANAMDAAADGYADDEKVLFGGEFWFAGRLREEAGILIYANVEQWAAEMAEAARAKVVNF